MLTANNKTIPTVKWLSLIGNVSKLAKNQLSFLLDARERYGDIYNLDLGVRQITMLNHPQHFEHVLVKNVSNYIKGEAYAMGRAIMKSGLIVSDGEEWRFHRRMLQPHFHRKYLNELAKTMLFAIDDSLIFWDKSIILHEPLDIVQAFSFLTMNVVVRTMFGVGISQDEMKIVNDKLDYIIAHLTQVIVTDSLPDWLPIPGKKELSASLKEINNVVRKLISQRRDSDSKEIDLLSAMINLIDEETGEKFNEDDLFYNVLGLFLAGHETTASTLSWFFYFLASHPEVYLKVYQEIDNVFADSVPDVENLSKLVYTNQVIQESLRIYPAANLVVRMAIQDDVISGYHIPAGSWIALSLFNVHRHPDFWPHAAEFDPDRFNDEQVKQRYKYAWVPFGAGQRLCIGREFSYLEMKFTIVSIVQRYIFSLIPNQQITARFGGVISPNGEILFNVKERKI